MGKAQTRSAVQELRRDAVKDMEDHPGLFRPHFAPDRARRPNGPRAWKPYLQRMATTPEWGDELTLLAIARVCKLQISILAADGVQDPIGPADGTPVWVAFRRESHYDALLFDASAPPIRPSPAPKRSKD